MLVDTDMIRVGQYDADEFKSIKEDEGCQQMIKDERIYLDGEYDTGCIWVKEGDGEAFEMACQYAF